MTRGEAKTHLSRKLGINLSDITSNDLFAASDLEDSIDLALKRVWDYKPWSFTEETYSATVDANSLSDGYHDYPDDATNGGLEDESIFRLTVNGLRWRKLNFEDYQEYLAQNSNTTDKIWSEHKRFYFFNVNALSLSDEINVTGKRRAPTLTADGDKLPFSPSTDNNESSGNQAIVTLAFADLLGSEKMKNYAQAAVEEKRAYTLLDVIWAPISQRKAREQFQDRPVFAHTDFFAQGRGGRRFTEGNF